MKKLFSFITTMVICGAMLSGCGNESASSPTTAIKTEKPQASGSSSSEGTTDDEFIVGFLFDSYVDDGAWTFEQNKARLALEKNGMKTLYKENVPSTQECEKVINDFINQGADVIVGGSFGMMDYMLKVAKAQPDVTFLHCGGYETLDNQYNFLGRQYQTRFLSGIIAGLETETNKLGYVAAFEIPEVIRQINAFTLGAQLVNPNIVVEVRWTHTWYDPSIEKEAGKSLIDDGCDVLTVHESLPTALEAAEEAGAMSIGYTSDIASVAPKSYLTSSAYNWTAYIVPTCNAIKAGTWEKSSFWGGLETGVVELTPFSDRVSQESKNMVEEYTQKIIDESYHVFEGPVYDQQGNEVIPAGSYASDEELLSMDYFVKGVIGEIN